MKGEGFRDWRIFFVACAGMIDLVAVIFPRT